MSSDNKTRTGITAVVLSMVSFQTGLALAYSLFDHIDVNEVAELRLFLSGIIFLFILFIIKPKVSRYTPATFALCMLLGLNIAVFALLFMNSVDRLDELGTASALAFLGPLSISIIRGEGKHRILWPGSAAVGVVLLTQPWTHKIDHLGVFYALAAASCWAGYIILAQCVAKKVSGIGGLAIAMPVAALVTTIVVRPPMRDFVHGDTLLAGLGMAIMMTGLPYSLEMASLRRLTAAEFGTLMSLEPAIAWLIGVAVLHQVPHWFNMAGICFVVLAGIGAVRFSQ